MNIEKKKSIKISACVFLWIIVCNLIVQIFTAPLAEIYFFNWAFFLINILFFLIEDQDNKRKFRTVFVGSIVGILAAGMMAYFFGQLLCAGIPQIPAVMIPLSICLFVMIVFHPLLPGVFNNCGFAYFLVSLIDIETSFVNMWWYMLYAAAGHIIVNGGSLVIIRIAERMIERRNQGN